MRKLIKNLETLENEIEKIIGTSNDSSITPLLTTQWSMSEDGLYINYDRYNTGDMWEYFQYQISSEGMRQENLFKGEKDGLHFIMAYEEDTNWNDSVLFIFDEKFKQEWNPSEDW